MVDEAVTDLIADAQAARVDEPRLGATFVDDVVALQRRRQLVTVPGGVSLQVFDSSPSTRQNQEGKGRPVAWPPQFTGSQERPPAHWVTALPAAGPPGTAV